MILLPLVLAMGVTACAPPQRIHSQPIDLRGDRPADSAPAETAAAPASSSAAVAPVNPPRAAAGEPSTPLPADMAKAPAIHKPAPDRLHPPAITREIVRSQLAWYRNEVDHLNSLRPAPASAASFQYRLAFNRRRLELYEKLDRLIASGQLPREGESRVLTELHEAWMTAFAMESAAESPVAEPPPAALPAAPSASPAAQVQPDEASASPAPIADPNAAALQEKLNLARGMIARVEHPREAWRLAMEVYIGAQDPVLKSDAQATAAAAEKIIPDFVMNQLKLIGRLYIQEHQYASARSILILLREQYSGMGFDGKYAQLETSIARFEKEHVAEKEKADREAGDRALEAMEKAMKAGDPAAAVMEGRRWTGTAVEPRVKTALMKAIDSAAANSRGRAESLFRQGAAAKSVPARTQLYKSAWAELKTALDRYPEAAMAPRMKENLASIERELKRLDPQWSPGM